MIKWHVQLLELCSLDLDTCLICPCGLNRVRLFAAHVMVFQCERRKTGQNLDWVSCHSYSESLFLCSFSLFIVLNIGSCEYHSNSKTGGHVDVADNDDDDAISGDEDEKEHRSAATLDKWGTFFTMIQPFLSILSFLFYVFLQSFPFFVMFL